MGSSLKRQTLWWDSDGSYTDIRVHHAPTSEQLSRSESVLAVLERFFGDLSREDTNFYVAGGFYIFYMKNAVLEISFPISSKSPRFYIEAEEASLFDDLTRMISILTSYLLDSLKMDADKYREEITKKNSVLDYIQKYPSKQKGSTKKESTCEKKK
jgi:hypothetical protein